MTPDAIDGLAPAGLWDYFAQLSRIPRESGNEKAAQAFVMRTAKGLGLSHAQDKGGNVVVRKPASSGREGQPSVCLQGHLDMVCVKRPGKVHDFRKDPITLVRDGEWVKADGTTLGADNGIAVATSLAIMADRSLEHGPLELLFTYDEERGLSGARALDESLLESRILLNLDSEDEGVLTVGCAGGADSLGTWALAADAAPKSATALDVRVTGLKGGHSGVEIHTQRGNAIKLLARVLRGLEPLGARVAKMEGGSKRNAIPAEAAALVSLPKAKAAEATTLAGELCRTFRAELGAVEPGLEVTVTPIARKPARVWKRALQRNVLRALTALPHGVVRMSNAIPGLVETSTNVAVLTQGPRSVVLATSQRSLVATRMDEMVATVRAILEMGGAKVTGKDPYPGWKPDMASPILAIAERTYADLYGRAPKVEAIHAGLECGIIGERIEGMDMVSLGPTIKDAHTPDERVEIAAVEKYWEYLLAILKNVT
jgi:dipeptidase D